VPAQYGEEVVAVPFKLRPAHPRNAQKLVLGARATCDHLEQHAIAKDDVRRHPGGIGQFTPARAQLVTAVGNGTATISATVGSVVGSATITVSQVVASVRVLPTDSVVKSASQLRAAALDARGNVIANAPLQWTSVTPAITSVSPTGGLTPLSTGVARVRVTTGAFSVE